MNGTTRRTALLGGLVLLSGACARTGSSRSAGGEGSGAGTRGGAAPSGAFTGLRPAPGYTVVDPALVDAARGEAGALTWYESTPDDQAAKVMDAFRKEYPFVTGARHQVLRAAEVASRIVQESQAGAPSANVAMTDGASMAELTKRNLLAGTDWRGAGVPAELVVDAHLVATSAAVYVLVSNRNVVPDAEAPKSWDDLTLDRWRAKVGVWESPYAFAELVPAWGEKRTQLFVDRMKSLQPRKFPSTFPLTQAVGAGEVPVGVAIFQSAQTSVRQGAPLRVVVPDPSPVTLIHAAVPAKAPHPKTAALFCAWLTSKSGATAFENATDKGNPLLPETAAGRLVRGRELSGFGPDKAAELSGWLKKFSG